MSNEMDLILTLAAPRAIDQDTLEEHTFQVLDAVEKHGPDQVLGPVVSANFANNSIELAFTVAAASLSAAQAIAAKVLKAIEKHTDISFTGAGTTATEQEPEDSRDLELVC